MSLAALKLARRVAPHIPQPVKKAIKFLMGRYRLVEGPLTYREDGLYTRHNCDFVRDPHFVEAYGAAKDTGAWGGEDIRWRVHVLCWAANRARNLEGDFVECGVNVGGFSAAAMRYIRFETLPKTFYLLDTYCGLVDRYLTEAERAQGVSEGGYEECYERVCRTFAAYPNVRIIRGAVPETLGQVAARKVAYLSIDMNCLVPEIAAAEFFWDKMVSGAAMILDDYGYRGHELQKQAFDAFAAKRGVEILQLPTCQGLILKP